MKRLPFRRSGKGFFTRLKTAAGLLKSEILVLYLALRHSDTPLFAKVFIGLVVGYALSPIDLVPDFIPLLGYLDDIVLIPLGIMLALRLVPPDVLSECRLRARYHPVTRLKSWLGGFVVVLVWLVVLGGIGYWAYRQFVN